MPLNGQWGPLIHFLHVRTSPGPQMSSRCPTKKEKIDSVCQQQSSRTLKVHELALFGGLANGGLPQ